MGQGARAEHASLLKATQAMFTSFFNFQLGQWVLKQES